MCIYIIPNHANNVQIHPSIILYKGQFHQFYKLGLFIGLWQTYHSLESAPPNPNRNVKKNKYAWVLNIST